MDIIVYFFVVLSLTFGQQVGVYQTLAECEADRAKVEALLMKNAKQRGDSYFVSPSCARVVVKGYGSDPI
jgi:hypothetical protein